MAGRRHLIVTGAVLASLVLIGAACGDSDEPADAAPPTTAAPTTQAPATTAAPTTAAPTTAAPTTAAPAAAPDDSFPPGTCARDGELQKVSFLMPFEFASLFFGTYIADLNGYFEEEVWMSRSRLRAAALRWCSRSSLETSSLECPTRAQSIDAVAQGHEIQTVYTYSTHLVYGFVTPVDSPLTVVEDFRGKTIGVSEATAGEVPFLHAYLASNGIDPETDVDIIESGGGVTTSIALDEGRIDGYFSDFFSILELETVMDLNHFDLGEFDLLHGATTIAQTSTIESNPDLIRCINRGVAKASEFTHESPEAALDIIRQAFPDQITDPTGFDIAAIKAMVEITTKYEDGGDRWGWNRPRSWQGYVDFLAARGELTADLDPTVLYTNDFIDDSNDFDPEPFRQAARAATP